jgi:hypothetical protein
MAAASCSAAATVIVTLGEMSDDTSDITLDVPG